MARAWTVAIALLLLSLHSSEPFRILSGNVPITWSGNEARLPGDRLFKVSHLYAFSVLGAVYTETRKTPRHVVQL